MGTRQSIKLGMVGGGPGSGIGPAHRYGASMDGAFKLVAGAFSRDPDKNAQMGESLGLNPERIYADFETMAEVERKLSDGIRAVSVVTPNDTGCPLATRSRLPGWTASPYKRLTQIWTYQPIR